MFTNDELDLIQSALTTEICRISKKQIESGKTCYKPLIDRLQELANKVNKFFDKSNKQY